MELRCGEGEVKLTAYLDTGAAHCLFRRSYAEMLGIDIEQGEFMRFSKANGSFDAYGHWVDVMVEDFAVRSRAFFPIDEAIKRNVLGRIGWLNKFRVAVDHNSCELFVEPLS